MKNIYNFLILVCFVAAIFSLASCKKTNEDLIVGTWRCTSVTCNPSGITESERLAALYTSAKFLFTAEKYFAVALPSETSYGFYTIDGDKLGIVISGNENSVIAQINHLDSKNLTFTFSQEVYDEDENGKGRHTNVAFTFNLEKLKE